MRVMWAGLAALIALSCGDGADNAGEPVADDTAATDTTDPEVAEPTPDVADPEPDVVDPEPDVVDPEPDADDAPLGHPYTVAGCVAGDSDWTVASLNESGPHKVGELSDNLVDESRVTQAHGLIPEIPFRTIPITVWYPAKDGVLGALTPELADGGPFPMLIHSHGFMSNRDEITYMSSVLASHGWVVVAPEFPLTHLGTTGGVLLLDVVEQPADVSFILDNLLGWSLTASHALHGAVDPDRIAASGVSLGGLTTQLVTYHRDVKDDRIKAAISLAGPAEVLSEAFWADSETPLMLVHGDIDAIVDYEANAVAAYERSGGLASLVTLVGGSHTSFASAGALLDGLTHNPDTFGCDALIGNLPEEEGFLDALADEEAGIVPPETPTEPCAEAELPPAMKSPRQHALTTAAVRAFLELALGAEKEPACTFLRDTLDAEEDATTE